MSVCVQGMQSCGSPMGAHSPHDLIPAILCSLILTRKTMSKLSLTSPVNFTLILLHLQGSGDFI